MPQEHTEMLSDTAEEQVSPRWPGHQKATALSPGPHTSPHH